MNKGSYIITVSIIYLSLYIYYLYPPVLENSLYHANETCIKMFKVDIRKTEIHLFKYIQTTFSNYNLALNFLLYFFHYHLVSLIPLNTPLPRQSLHCCPCPWILFPFCSVLIITLFLCNPSFKKKSKLKIGNYRGSNVKRKYIQPDGNSKSYTQRKLYSHNSFIIKEHVLKNNE